MAWRGLIITGVSGGGKTTLSCLLREHDELFEQVKAVTTREPRSDDEPGSYEHLTEKEFDRMSDSLIIWAEYRGKRYGITCDHISDVVGRGKVPILVVTPKSLSEFLERSGGEGNAPFLTVFIDAPDDGVNARLNLRGGADRMAAVVQQRAEDRAHRGSCHHVLQNIVLAASLGQILEWWRQGHGSRDR